MVAMSFVKLARSLDQGEPDAIPAKLNQLWEILSSSPRNSFHASEEVALKWLLKTMNGTSANAEKVRRWPLAWSVIGCIFQRMPLFSLAKSLASRQFVSIVQQTAKDLSNPQKKPSTSNRESLDTEMTGVSPPRGGDNVRKRKRHSEAPFDLDTLRNPERCLESAESLFEALHTLLARLDSKLKPEDQPSNESIGAEHIKSLFCSPAAELMETFTPLLRICNSALTVGSSEPLEHQDTWIFTFVSLWNFHLQGPTDSMEVAAHLAPFACVILGKLSGVLQPSDLTLEPEVQRAWTGALQHFLTSNVILPARSAFLNRQDYQTLVLAVGDGNPKSIAIRSAVLFNMALRAPRIIGGAAAKKDNEDWIQKVFDKIEEPLRSLDPAERNRVMTRLLEMSVEHGIPPSLDSLRSVCHNYALEQKMTDWRLVSAIASCDVDVFLISQAGVELLDNVLRRIPHSKDLAGDEYDAASAFVTSLARGFAQARNLPDFLNKWFENLAKCDTRALGPDTSGLVWFNRGIRAAVAKHLQTSLSKEQLLGVLDELGSSQEASAVIAKLVVFDAISAALTLEDYVDAVDSRLFDEIHDVEGYRSWPSDIRSIRWRVTRRTLSWSEFDKAKRIWKKSKAPLKQVTDKSAILDPETFEAFTCSYAAWLSLKFGGKHEEDAQTLVLGFLGRLNEELSGLDFGELGGLLRTATQHAAVKGDFSYQFGESFTSKTACLASYLGWMLCSSSRFIDLVTKNSDGFPTFLSTLLALTEKHMEEAHVGDLVSEVVLTSLLDNPNSVQNERITSTVIGRSVKALEENSKVATSNISKTREALQILLRVPVNVIARPLREWIMSSLRSITSSSESSPDTPWTLADWFLALDLMTRVMQQAKESTIYEGMNFGDLTALGRAVQDAVKPATLRSALELVTRFRYLAAATLRQMISILDEREKQYLRGIGAEMSKWKGTNTPVVVRLILQHAILSNLKPTSRAASEHIVDRADIESRLATDIAVVIVEFLREVGSREITSDDDTRLLPLLVALDASKLDGIQAPLFQHLHKHLANVKATDDMLCAKGLKVGWKLKAFLAHHFRDQAKQSREIQFRDLFSDNEDKGEASDEAAASSLYVDSELLRDYMAGQIKGYDEKALLSYLQELIGALGDEGGSVGQLLAIHYIAARLSNSQGTRSQDGAFDLGTAHSMLVRRLSQATTRTEFKLLARTVNLLLEESAASMSQWNIDSTLSSVSAVCVDQTLARDIKSSPRTYDQLCHLVEAILKRHRLRLEGRFHLVVMTLQSLLTYLVTHSKAPRLPPAGSGGGGWEKEGRRFSRLLELVCEPSAASVARTQTHTLSSAKDAAKRSAGQYMYLVVMTYIKLQLESNVSLGVREALEPGIFSILSITSDESRNIMNDAMDPSGRALFRDLYRKWHRFGKWKLV